MLVAHGLLHAFGGVLAAPGLPKGRVGEHEAHGLALEAIFLHGVCLLDALLGLAFYEHVGEAHGVRLGVDLLPVEVDLRVRAQLVQGLLGAREHAAGAAGHVEHLDDLAGFAEVFAALREHELGEQVHHLAWRVVVARLCVL